MQRVRDTSIEAHRTSILSGRKQSYRERVVSYLLKLEPGDDRTRWELSVELGIPVNRLTGPIFTAIESGLIRELDPRPDRYSSNKASHALEAVRPDPTQRKFAWPI